MPSGAARIPSREAVSTPLIERDHVAPERARWAAAVAQNHIGRAKHMALSETAADERRKILDIPGKLTSVGATIRLAGRIVDEAAETAKARVEERNAKEAAISWRPSASRGEDRAPVGQGADPQARGGAEAAVGAGAQR